MDLTRPSSGHDQAEDPLKIHHLEEEEHHESRASRMLGRVKAKAKKLKNRLTKHGIDGNEHDHDLVDDEEEDESDELEPEKHVTPVNEVYNVRGYRTSQPESMSHLPETNVQAPEEIIPSGTKDSTAVYSSDHTERVVPEHEVPAYPVRTSDVSDREDSRETHQVPLNTPVSLLSATSEDAGEDELLGGQREANTERPKRFEDDLSGEFTYQSKTPYHTQQGSGEAGEDYQKSESEIRKNLPTVFGGKAETEPSNDFPVKSHHFDQTIESEIGNDSLTLFGRNPETGPRDDFPTKSHDFDQKIESIICNNGGKQGTERREDFLGKSYEFDQEIRSTIGRDSPTKLSRDEKFPTRSDDMKVETGLGRDLPTGTDDHFSPKFSGPKERDDFDSQTGCEAQEPKPTTQNAVASSLGYSVETTDGQRKIPVGVETVTENLTSDDENVQTTELPLSGDRNAAEETEQEEEKGVAIRDHLVDKLTPEEDEEDKAFSDMVAEKLNLGEKKTKTVEVAVEKIPSNKLHEEIEHGGAAEEEGKGGGGIVGTIKGVYNYWLGGTKEEVKPKSPVSAEESPQSLGSTVGTKGFLDSGESRFGETSSSTGALPVQKGL